MVADPVPGSSHKYLVIASVCLRGTGGGGGGGGGPVSSVLIDC